MLASVLAEGTTIIENAAKEPHIVDVANFLNSAGANIIGAGTDSIKINGVKELNTNVTYSVVPDQIEAGTFMLAAIATKGDLIIKNCIPEHLDCLTSKILEIGGNVEMDGDNIHVWCNTRPSKATIKTLPYPRISYGFATSDGCGPVASKRREHDRGKRVSGAFLIHGRVEPNGREYRYKGQHGCDKRR